MNPCLASDGSNMYAYLDTKEEVDALTEILRRDGKIFRSGFYVSWPMETEV